MINKITAFFGSLMFVIGLLGFFMPNVLYLIQFDLFQSFIYVVLGAIGLKLGFGQSTTKSQLTYLQGLAITNLLLMMIGIFWPNLGDIVHLEVPEHFFHGAVGLTSALAADYFRKRQTIQ
ncbi:MAG: hypothetical protein UV57_C0003G0029 [Parcubacteria group bacterium GW2011_GWD2_43_10]|uniref:DUF4383 domain-containing protein n=5 Tax=Candidatus Vebleniibacteriota TaxID=1817921 RepID=A0A1G2Q6Q7_9BACT|nr:MAG: hypothetical protein UV47_C0012G0005 [Parcubacteria group bacterium GW2011_GWA2_42_80]KKS79259.1 MAG: hypothetical protein UV52_C0013G0004 [Parcubacteria group bacterium GW2011_GWD1_42_9]KKS83995.1 MAG: hypothetical protein UV57_C0003G0029 [Parcubacteria group bacterium GW2011_GWD2_43_10]KKS94139.1 MAG: hypothetical protein UV69_C0001G0028 [Parcubacteria group bacterium GW2011_GWE2_43_12]KKT14015.1 MAG: hypothetical protein UV92_C0008G0006 [Parcubacteria group bacterium GW2011_GWA1_43_2